MERAVYVFLSPFPVFDTINMIKSALNKPEIDHQGVITAQLRAGFGKPNHNVSFYVGDYNGFTLVRVLAGYTPTLGTEYVDKYDRALQDLDAAWEQFILRLTSANPNIDFGIYPGLVSVCEVMEIGESTSTVYTTTEHTVKHGLGKSILGYVLAGPAGAIVGATLGSSNTVAKTSAVNTQEPMMRVRFTNGRISQGKVNKSGNFYNEIMVNMQMLYKNGISSSAYSTPSINNKNSLSGTMQQKSLPVINSSYIKKAYCYKCGYELASNSDFCSRCGTAQSKYCIKCGNKISINSIFCNRCGYKQ